MVDGTARPANPLGPDARWVAVCSLSPRAVGLMGREVAPAALRLVAVEDVTPFLGSGGL